MNETKQLRFALKVALAANLFLLCSCAYIFHEFLWWQKAAVEAQTEHKKTLVEHNAYVNETDARMGEMGKQLDRFDKVLTELNNGKWTLRQRP